MHRSTGRGRRARATVLWSAAFGLLLVIGTGVPVTSAAPGASVVAAGNPTFPVGNTTGPNASLVVGQANFTSDASGASASTLCGPEAAVVGPHGNLWVADTCNNRVLEFVPPLHPGMVARIVLGQENFSADAASSGPSGLSRPIGLAFDASGGLWVADSGNNRVLEFTPPLRTGMAATLAIGQESLTTDLPGTSATQLDGPEGVAFGPGGQLWVADTQNNRILEFVPPFSTGQAAALVLGQSGFDTAVARTSPSGLRDPGSVAVSANGTLYVADTGNNRVLSFPAPHSTAESANAVVGQTNFYSGGQGLGPSALDEPTGIAVGSNSTLWVADAGNDRAVRFAAPFVNGAAATYVAGQPNAFTNASGPRSAGSLADSMGVAFDPATAGVWIADTGDARMLLIPGNAGVVSSVVLVATGGSVIAINPLTRINVTVSGGSRGTSLLVVTQRLSAAPAEEVPAPYANASYFAVAVNPTVSGSSTICYSGSPSSSLSSPTYWNGTAWHPVATTLAPPATVCIDIPLGELIGATFAVRGASPPNLGGGTVAILIYGTIGFIVAAALAVTAYNVRRRRRGPPPLEEGPYRSPL